MRKLPLPIRMGLAATFVTVFAGAIECFLSVANATKQAALNDGAVSDPTLHPLLLGAELAVPIGLAVALIVYLPRLRPRKPRRLRAYKSGR